VGYYLVWMIYEAPNRCRQNLSLPQKQKRLVVLAWAVL
jgi:hypothetical protein